MHAYNGSRSLLLTGSSVYLQAALGPGFTSGAYYCKNYDIGSGSFDPVTGVGTGQMRDGQRCDISGGSGGPSTQNDYRAVALKFGATCLSVTDQATGPSVGTQSVRVIIMRP